jgi:hypothetical protein
MAEILSVIASGISVAQRAVQFTSSVIKLKAYIDAIKDAPEDIRALVEEIEGFKSLLEEVELAQAHQVAVWGSKSTMRSLAQCKRAVSD